MKGNWLFAREMQSLKSSDWVSFYSETWVGFDNLGNEKCLHIYIIFENIDLVLDCKKDAALLPYNLKNEKQL